MTKKKATDHTGVAVNVAPGAQPYAKVPGIGGYCHSGDTTMGSAGW